MALVGHVWVEAVERTAVGVGKGVVDIDFHDAPGVAENGRLADMDMAYRVIVVVRRQKKVAVHLDLYPRRVYELERRGRQRLQLILFRSHEALLTEIRASLHTGLVMLQHSLHQCLVQFLDQEERHLPQLGIDTVVYASYTRLHQCLVRGF